MADYALGEVGAEVVDTEVGADVGSNVGATVSAGGVDDHFL